MNITNGNQTNRTPVASMTARDGRIALLWSLDPVDVAEFVSDLAGPPPPEPNWVSSGTVEQTTGTASTLAHASGSTSITVTESGDAKNAQMMQAWQAKLDQWNAEVVSAEKVADAIVFHHQKEGPK